jgi:hypothetical protein
MISTRLNSCAVMHVHKEINFRINHMQKLQELAPGSIWEVLNGNDK